MTAAPVVYVLDGRLVGATEYTPILDPEGYRVSFRGVPAKAQSIAFAASLSKLPTYDGLKVIRQQGPQSETVWQWTKQGGIPG
jgi:hypothetical protein